MGGLDLEPSTPAQARVTWRFFFTVGWKILAAGVADFVLLRIWGPNLVNLHQDWALAGGVLCLALAIAVTLWLLFQLWLDTRRLAAARRAWRTPTF